MIVVLRVGLISGGLVGSSAWDMTAGDFKAGSSCALRPLHP
jgi:hypothetical protein